MVGVIHEEIILSSPSGIIDSIGQAKQAQTYLQSDLKCYVWISTKFKNTFYFSEFSTALLIHSLMRSVKHSRKLALLLWWKCLEFHGKKNFYSIKCLCVCTVLFTVLALILLYGGHCFLVQLSSKVTRSFTHRVRLPASRNNAPQHISMFPYSTIAAWWRSPV